MTMKKIVALVMTIALLLTAASAFADGEKTYRIGIIQFAEHGSLDNCRQGFIEGLAEEGFADGVNVEFDIQNAQADTAITAQIASVQAEKCDLICAIATPAAMAAYNVAEGAGIPVIYTAVSDPVAASLANSDGTNPGQITGTSDALPVEAQLKLIRAMMPQAKTIGILYTTSEPNSVSTIAEYQAKAGEYGFTIDAVGVTAQSEVTQGADTLISHGVDCFSNLTDNNVVGVLPSILEKTNEAGIPVYGSEIEQVKLGCAASAGIDYVQLGRQTGAMAAKVIRGETACADIPYETIDAYSTYLNSDVLDAMGISVPAEIAANAVEANAA